MISLPFQSLFSVFLIYYMHNFDKKLQADINSMSPSQEPKRLNKILVFGHSGCIDISVFDHETHCKENRVKDCATSHYELARERI